LKELRTFGGPLCSCSLVSDTSRYVIPALLVTASGFFWSALFCRAVAVTIYIKIAGENAFPALDMNISVWSFITLWWKTGDKFFAFALLFNVCVPAQLKAIGTLLTWFAPVSIISVSSRGAILKFFDSVGRLAIFGKLP
jgi:hypothetical protein